MRDLFSSIKKLSLGAAIGTVLGLLAFGQAAEAANFLEKNFGLFGPRYDGGSGRRANRRSTGSPRHVRRQGKPVLEFQPADHRLLEDVHEIAYRPWQSNTIPRRYCSATAMVSDGKPRTVNYSIIEDGGWASFGERPRVLRRGAGPQLGLQPGLPDGPTVSQDPRTSRRIEKLGQWVARCRYSGRCEFHIFPFWFL